MRFLVSTALLALFFTSSLQAQLDQTIRRLMAFALNDRLPPPSRNESWRRTTSPAPRSRSWN